MSTSTSAATIEDLRVMFATHGLPEVLVMVFAVIHQVIVPLSEKATVVSEPASEVISNASPPEVSVPVTAASPVRLSASPKSVPVTPPLCRSSRLSKHPDRLDL